MYTKDNISSEKDKLKIKRFKLFSISKNIGAQTFGYSFLFFYLFISLFPFIWSFFASFMNPHLISLSGINPIPKSGEWTLTNYKSLFNGSASEYVGSWIKNTILFAFTLSLLNATLNLLAGYALADINMKGKRMLISYFLIIILVPGQATFMPTFFIFSKLGIINKSISPNIFIMAIIFSGMANIIMTFMARQFFLTQTKELEEAAKIEGYSNLKIFFKITIKKMLPLFATQFVLSFMGAWNSYLTFTLYSVGDPNKMTINSGILNIASSAIDVEVGYGQTLAMSNISFIPMIIIYIISLKIQLRGIKGGVK